MPIATAPSISLQRPHGVRPAPNRSCVDTARLAAMMRQPLVCGHVRVGIATLGDTGGVLKPAERHRSRPGPGREPS